MRFVFVIVAILLTAKLLNAQTAEFETNLVSNTICLGDTVIFTNKSENYLYSFWQFGDGYETYTQNPVHSYINSGIFTVKLTVFDSLGISDTDSLQIEVNKLPELELFPKNDTTIIFGKSITISASGNFDIIFWSTGEQTSEIIVTQAGTYSCNVFFYNLACSNADYVNIFVSQNTSNLEFSEIIINNILTPNNDGINDYFFIKDIDLNENPCEILVYNSSGQTVYSNTTYSNNWNGTSSDGNILETGTYYVLLKFADKQAVTGFIDIIR